MRIDDLTWYYVFCQHYYIHKDHSLSAKGWPGSAPASGHLTWILLRKALAMLLGIWYQWIELSQGNVEHCTCIVVGCIFPNFFPL